VDYASRDECFSRFPFGRAAVAGRDELQEDAGAVKTQPSAKTMAFDPKTKKIFLPAAEYQEIPATEPGKRPQRSLKPGSFAVLVVGK